MSKQNALDTAINLIEKQFGKGSIMRLGANRSMDVETISTGSLALDIALGAGGYLLAGLLRYMAKRRQVKRL